MEKLYPEKVEGTRASRTEGSRKDGSRNETANAERIFRKEEDIFILLPFFVFSPSKIKRYFQILSYIFAILKKGLQKIVSHGIHHICGGAPGKKFILHKIHRGRTVAEEAVVAFTEIVQAGFTVGSVAETVLRTLPVAGKEKVTFTALAWKGSHFRISEILLDAAVHHLGQGVGADVPQLVLREDKVVTHIDIPVVLHHSCVTAGACHSADSRLLPHPVCESGIEKLDVIPPHVIAHPLVKNGAEEIPPLLRSYRERCKRQGVAVSRTG